MNTRKTITLTVDPIIFKEVRIQLIKNDSNNLSRLVEELFKEWLTKQK